ncbi:MAG: NAD-dependent epimerase/dehydratase family protein [Candidatus Korarchaeota archaeon]|nr:NAD-dependent epimerase/dehydratase family protein [Candidatus Korarchaeota archaeon]
MLQLRAVVTGGAGFIGSNLTAKLLKDGAEVVVIDNFMTGSREVADLLKERGATLLEGTSSSIRELTPVDVVFHLGIPSSSPMYRENPDLLSLAVRDAIAIFEYAKESGAKVVYASTSSLYNGNDPPFTEDMPVFPTDFYTEGRYWMERLAKVYHELHGVESVGLRLFSVYGPNERPKSSFANVASQMVWAALEGRSFVIYGDGKQTRDFIYVTDVVRAFLMAWERGEDYEVYNVGTGKETSFNELAELIRSLGLDLMLEYRENPIKNYVYRTLADTRKAERDLGFKYEVELEEGLMKVIRAYREKGLILAY